MQCDWQTDPPELPERRVWVHHVNGNEFEQNSAVVANHWGETYIAYRELPERYQPPKRMYYWLSKTGIVRESPYWDAVNECPPDAVTYDANMPEPDALAEVVAEMRERREVAPAWLVVKMNQWLARLDPRTAEDQRRIDEGESV